MDPTTPPSAPPGPAGPTEREVRAAYSADTVVVYQAYSAEIARPALDAQRLVPPFRLGRMTWIKPSFFWMMYRSGWAQKPGQERVLRLTIRRDAFDWALDRAVLSHFDPSIHGGVEAWREAQRGSPVTVQWDPERDALLRPLPYRAIQIGLRGEAARRYASEWIVAIEDATAEAHAAAAAPARPAERRYPVEAAAARRLGVTA